MPITVGTVEVEVVPVAQGITQRLRAAMLPAATQVGREAGREMGERMTESLRQQVATSASSIGQQLGQQIAARMQAEIRDALRSAVAQGGHQAQASAVQSGNRVGGAFARAMRTRIEAAIRSLPDITIGANTSAADAEIQALRVRLETLGNKRIGIDIDAAAARAEAEDIEEQLRRIGASHPDVRIRTDTAAARTALAEFRAEIDRLSANAVSVRLDVDGGFAQRLRASVEAAQAQLPDITIGANTAQAAAELQSLRGQLEALRTVRVGVDVDAATALARVNEVQARLEALAASRADVQVRVDAAAAAAQLAAVQAQVNALDGDTARVDIDVSSAVAGLVRLSTLAAGVGPALVPAFAAAAFGVGAFASVLSAATAGVGLFAAASVPSILGVGKAIQATTAANEALAAAQDKTSRGGASQAIAAQQQALAMAGAQQALASAQRSSAQQVADARRRERDAIEGVADAQEQAAQRMDQALDKINAADRQRTAALRDQEQAQKALADAQKAAAEQAEELEARRAGGALAERSAVLAVEKAQLGLDEVRKSGADANSLAAREAQLAYDEAVQRLQDQRRENGQLAEESTKANRGVLQAEEALAAAKARTVDATEAVRDAQADAARTQVEGSKAVARAQQQVSDAQLAVVRAQQSGADAVASAQRQIASAQLAAAASAAQQASGVDAANTALDKQQRALEGLSPAQRGLYDAVLRLKEGFKAWGASLAPDTMPLLTRALDGLTGMLPGLSPLVKAAADGIGALFDRGKAAFEDPFWDRFKANLILHIPRAIESMGVVFGNIFAGMGGVINAFLPQTDQIAGTMERVTGHFREWGQQLDQSKGFRDFTDYIHETWPGIKETFGDVGGALWQITKALSEVSPSAVLILQGVATAIDATPVWVLQTLVDLFFAYRVAVAAVAIAQGIYTVATGLATVSTWSLTAALRALSTANIFVFLLTLVGVFVLLMIQSEGFRNKVIGVFKEIGSWGVWLWQNALKPAFDAIVSAALWVYDKGIKPAFDGIKSAIGAVGSAAMWLWNNAIKPTFDVISFAARLLAVIIITVLVTPVYLAFQILAGIVLVLWEYAFKPTFEAIGAAAGWLWDNVLKPIVGFIVDSIRGWGLIAKWLWEEAIKPAVDGISGAISWLWTQVIKPDIELMKMIFQEFGDKGTWLWEKALKPVFGAIGDGIRWVYDWMIKPTIDSAKEAFEGLGKFIQKIHDEWIKPWMDKIGTAVGSVTGGFKSAFDTAKQGIGEVWDGIKKVVADPINWVIDFAYGSMVKVWGAVASKLGIPELPGPEKFHIGGYATGGIYPGYTPGRDVGVIGISGGEAIMRPEWTRAVGSDYVHSANAAARAGGVEGVRRFTEVKGLPYLGGFDLGGIPGVDDIKNKGEEIVRGVAAKGVEALLSPIRALVNATFPDTPDIAKLAKNLPLKLMDHFVQWVKDDDAKQGGGEAVARALEWAKTQAGKKYQWGGSGNPSWDCCIIGTVRVYGPNGATPIQDVRAGDKVFSYVDGKLTVETVTAAWKSKTQQVYKVRTRNRTVTASANHPFMRLVEVEPYRRVKGGKRGENVPARYDIEWARLDELQRGDLLVQPRAMESEVVESPRLPDGTPVTEDVAWLLGLFVGDGYVTHNTIRICVYDDNSVRAQNIFRGLGINSFTSPKHGVVASSVAFVKTLDEGMGLRCFGPEKRVPDAVWTWPPELRQAFLDGYCAADGHRPTDQAKHGERTYHSASRELIEDVRALHMMLGQPVSNISTNERKKPIVIRGKEVRNARPLHAFTVWAGEGRGEVALRKRPGIAAWLDAGDFTVAKVLEITDEGVQDTYDLEVEGAHNFVADGVVVHNSGFMAGIEQTILGRKPGRLWTTFDFAGSSAPAGWELNKQAPFMVGVNNFGPGHMAGTLGGVNVESRGGDGVVVGPAARGWNDAMFYNHYGFTPSIQAGFAGNAPSGLLATWIRQALDITGTPPPNSLAAWMAGMATIVSRESGGNVRAENTTDSNARAGNGSRGLAQVVPTTFQAYHAPGTSWDIFDPVANLAAAVNWIKYKYGDISKVQQANPNKPPKGYAFGGIVPPLLYDTGGYLPPGLNLTYNGTGSPEAVLTARQESALFASVSGGDGGLFTGRLTLDSGEFLGVVSGQIERAQGDLARQFEANPMGR